MLLFTIVNNAKSFELEMFVTFMWPLIGLVESSIVVKNDEMSDASESVLLMYMYVADAKFALLNLKSPAPGSESAVFVSNAYLNVAPPKLPCAPVTPVLP
ncbi:MAG: hypothetical protein EBS60_05415 [Verrucomicrobia bacterium]|nr:hypothetical protein [Verrucomicrobiota bacterium]